LVDFRPEHCRRLAVEVEHSVCLDVLVVVVVVVIVVVVDGNNDEYRILQFVVEHKIDPVWQHDWSFQKSFYN
jgi:hypothetical protein